MTEIYCNHEGCLHFKAFEDGPRHLPGSNPVDWDKGYSGYCQKETIGIKVKIIEDLKRRQVIPECQCYATRKDWRLHLPYPDEIDKRSQKRILGSQEHDSSR